ncbi:hypothetical protein JXA32_10285 [Candidatus Sumerlaeota bacterium]|nr:hypothetical protein [Candidatus Sumerlaeota bacterium]
MISRTLTRALGVLLLLFLAQGSGHAQIYVSNDTEFVNEITQFTLVSLSLGLSGSEEFIYNGVSYVVEVFPDGTIEMSQGGTIIYSGYDFGEFESYLFGYLVVVSEDGTIIILPEEIDISTIVQQKTSQVVTEVPGGPMDEVFSQIVLGRSVGGRLAIDVDKQGAGVAMTEGSAMLRYTRFQSGGAEGNIFGLTFGWEKETDRWRYGVVVPYDHIDYDSTVRDGDSFTISPYLQYIALREPVRITAGPYLIFNYTFINNNDDFDMHGAGLSASMEKYFNRMYLRYGSSVEYVDTNVDLPTNSVVRWRNGITLGATITDSIESRLYFMNTISDEGLLGGDDNYSSLGAEVAARVSDAFAMTLGLQTSIGHADTTVYSVYFGGQAQMR